jgi:hypothetical protein
VLRDQFLYLNYPMLIADSIFYSIWKNQWKRSRLLYHYMAVLVLFEIENHSVLLEAKRRTGEVFQSRSCRLANECINCGYCERYMQGSLYATPPPAY